MTKGVEILRGINSDNLAEIAGNLSAVPTAINFYNVHKTSWTVRAGMIRINKSAKKLVFTSKFGEKNPVFPGT